MTDPPSLKWSAVMFRKTEDGVHPVFGPGFMRLFEYRSVGRQSCSALSFRAMNAVGFRCSLSSIH